eukprot:scaffold3989_cov69-Phaeocystis_antarctica.AAC.1
MRSHRPQALPPSAGRDAPMLRLPAVQARSTQKSIAKSDCRSATASLSAIRCRTANSGISGPRVGVLASIAETATLAPTATATALRTADESGERGNRDSTVIGASCVTSCVELVASGSGEASEGTGGIPGGSEGTGGG